MKKDVKRVPKLRFSEFEGEWKECQIRDFGKVITGSTPPTSQREFYGGDRLFVSPFDIQENRYVYKTKTTLTEKGFRRGRKISNGSVLFVCIGSTIGKIGQAVVDCVTNQQINAIVVNNENDASFVYSLLEYKSRKIKKLAGKQAVPIINKSTFENYYCFRPTNPEQQKIASFLSAVDQKIQQLTRKKELLEQYKKGVMQKTFSREIRFKNENGKNYQDWEEKRLEDILTFISTNSLSRNDLTYESGEIKNIHYGDIHTTFKTGFDVEKENVPYINSGIDVRKIKEEQFCQVGDVVIADASEDYIDIGKAIEIWNVRGEKIVAGLHTFLGRDTTGQTASVMSHL